MKAVASVHIVNDHASRSFLVLT